MAEILHHLGCFENLVNNGINYQPQLVFTPDFWTINSMFSRHVVCLQKGGSTKNLSEGIPSCPSPQKRPLSWEPGQISSRPHTTRAPKWWWKVREIPGYFRETPLSRWFSWFPFWWYMGCQPKNRETPQNGWWKQWKTLLKWDDLGGPPLFFGNIHISQIVSISPLLKEDVQFDSCFSDEQWPKPWLFDEYRESYTTQLYYGLFHKPF